MTWYRKVFVMGAIARRQRDRVGTDPRPDRSFCPPAPSRLPRRDIVCRPPRAPPSPLPLEAIPGGEKTDASGTASADSTALPPNSSPRRRSGDQVRRGVVRAGDGSTRSRASCRCRTRRLLLPVLPMFARAPGRRRQRSRRTRSSPRRRSPASWRSFPDPPALERREGTGPAVAGHGQRTDEAGAGRSASSSFNPSGTPIWDDSAPARDQHPNGVSTAAPSTCCGGRAACICRR